MKYIVCSCCQEAGLVGLYKLDEFNLYLCFLCVEKIHLFMYKIGFTIDHPFLQLLIPDVVKTRWYEEIKLLSPKIPLDKPDELCYAGVNNEAG